MAYQDVLPARKKQLAPSRLRVDEDIQPRCALLPKLVAEYVEALERGVKFPPVDVFFDGIFYWVGDGVHRREAYLKAGRAEIPCNVYEGSRERAQWFAAAANQAHGQRRTNGDKRRAVEMALGLRYRLSDRQIADHAGVDHKTVATIREELQRRGEIPHVDTRADSLGRQQPAEKAQPTEDEPEAPIIEQTAPPTCPNCGGHEIDADGDCTSCLEPDIGQAAAEADVPTNCPEIDPRRLRAVGLDRANEAIDCLKRIPRNDYFRNRGFQIVADWISQQQIDHAAAGEGEEVHKTREQEP